MNTLKRLSLVLAVLTVAGCGTPEPAVEGIGFTPPPGGRPLSSYDPQIDDLLARMTLAEKIGQMTQADQQFLKDPSDIETLFLGSLLSGGDSDPRAGNSFEAWRDMVENYRARALRTRLAIPLLYGVDAVHGHNNVLGAVIFPHNIGLGATRNPDLVARISRITAVEMRATGIHWTFAPCVTVPRDDRWGRTYEGFSEDPELVKELGEAAVRGLQGDDLSHPLSVLACSKHYLADGGTAWGTGTVARSDGSRYPLDRGDTRLDEPTLRKLHLPGYVTTIAAGVGTIMPSYSSWNGEKLSGHKYLLTDVLKNELGFQGFLISDYNAIDELPGSYRDQVRQSVNAGMDMMMVPERYREFIDTLTSLVQAGEVPMERIDDAVRRILRVKFAMGLFSETPVADRSLAEKFGSAEHREVARDAVRQSLVLLKNEGVLPLSRTARRIHVSGRGADNLGMQCGGWTIKWQGGMGRVTDGTTILEGIRLAVDAGTEVTWSEDGSGAGGADFAVVVVGEEPYAEFLGDREDLSLSPDDVATISRVKATGTRTVVVLLSGRPLILEPILNLADAIVAAWLPGSEGQGVTDVLFGDYKPTGKLPFSWPQSMSQVLVNAGEEPYQPLYAYGYGLSY